MFSGRTYVFRGLDPGTYTVLAAEEWQVSGVVVTVTDAPQQTVEVPLPSQPIGP